LGRGVLGGGDWGEGGGFWGEEGIGGEEVLGPRRDWGRGF